MKHLTFDNILNTLNKIDFEKRFNDSKFRHFHTLEHVKYICNLIDKDNHNEYDKTILYLVAFYHDFVYQTYGGIAEYRSAESFIKDFESNKKLFNKLEVDEILAFHVHDIILQTCESYSKKDLLLPLEHTKTLSKTFYSYDHHIVGNVELLYNYEDQIQKEFQRYKLPEYITGRIDFINKEKISTEIKRSYEHYIKNKTYNVAVFPGSFSLMHEGHLDIISKASVIFDKVVIVGMNNPNKAIDDTRIFPDIINGSFETRISGKMVYEFVEELSNEYKKANIRHNITVIKGLRNSTDFDYEYSQMKWIHELSKKNIPYMYIPANPSLGHVSSSAIKAIRQFNPEYKEYVLQ